ncbi:MAG: T9SS type A sorting domain-containing protein [Bacteroidetes bacterium]|nr:MAG: T9SS type A sorting domain-containing protein [Bacteroidota bacterium]
MFLTSFCKSQNTNTSTKIMKNIHSLFRILLVCIGALSAQISFAQTTGSFTRTVNFGGNPSWALCYYVPASYNAANKYKLIIGLHGLGDTPQNYRSYLAGVSTTSGSPVYNSIVVAPYAGGDVNTDFWSPVSDTGIITKSITDALSAYNIDPEYIYLNGFSLGGRSALRYGLLNYWRFRGLELWTPAIQSMNEANNLTSFKYVWQNGKHIPICMSVGSEDSYGGIIAAAHQHLSDSGAIVNYQIVDGMGHTGPPNSYKFACFDYLNINATSYAVNDAGVSVIATPFDEECNTSFTPSVTIQNKGINNLTSVTLNYQIDNGTVNTYNWSGNLILLGASKVILPSQSVSAGAHTFKAYTTLPNGVADALASNDAMTKNFSFITNGAVSLAEGFEGVTYPPTGWKCAGPDNAWSWVKKSGGTSGGNGLSASSIRFDNYTPDNTGKRYSIRTQQYDFTNTVNPVLSYDYAYVPYQSGSGITTDTLAVYYSTDCGSSWTFLMKKGGAALSTAGAAINTVFVPTSAQWKKEIINLTGSLTGQSRVMFSFEDISGYGNMLYLDNINLTGITGIVNEMQEQEIVIYPNPSKGMFNVQWLSRPIAGQPLTIEVKNVLGQIMYSEQWNEQPEDHTKQLDLKTFGKGFYFVSLKTAHSETVKKVIVY